MDEDQIGIECARLAIAQGGPISEVIDTARRLRDFVQRTNDAEILDAARALAETVKR